MKCIGRKAGLCFLISLLAIFLLLPTAFASSGATLVINGQDFEADLYLEDGLSYISAASLNKLPGINEEQDGYIALRDYFESRDGIVDWDNDTRVISVTWYEKRDGRTADELTVHTSTLLEEVNTYKMTGDLTMKMSLQGLDLEGVPEMPDMSNLPEMTYTIEGLFQQEPLAMYMKQIMELPEELLDATEGEQELTEEEMASFEGNSMTTEIVWKDDAIYQKTPFAEQWIVQDLSELSFMDELTNLMNTNPQQTLELMREFGVENVFGDDLTIDEQEYYLVKSHVDSKAFQKMMDEMLGDFDFGEMMAATMGASIPVDSVEGEDEDFAGGMTMVFEQLMSSMKADYNIDSYINKETLLTETMFIDMSISFELDLAEISKMIEDEDIEGILCIEMEMSGEMNLSDFGTEMEFPDVSNAITQQELIQQMMEALSTEEYVNPEE